MNVRVGTLLLFSLIAQTTEACTFKQAVYVHTADSSWKMSFHPFKHKVFLSDMAAHIENTGSKASFWFLFDAGSARYINLISTTNVLQKNWEPPDPDGGKRPLGEMHVFFWDSDMKVMETVPQAESPAPRVVFIPDLSEVLTFRAPVRYDLQAGMFKLDYCGH